MAKHIGAEPRRALLEIVGGQGPQHLITELAGEIAAGRSDVALVFGWEATSALRYFAGRDDKPRPSTVACTTAGRALRS
ncbi:hypothetical protein [Mycobacterium gastri]|uniref:Uncharacterized protein n=1 Tax=Mycobacterium gastri TaxID=1777 RepID=A0A1X1UV70_MYCGS|nr:hypothetical protein [Mycobacterium gastri]ETW26220.1 hypothetical protein MGAST_28640 [Mycobacterium gastri 'Wayne']ORV60707.1 hypothetical protein AWC07_18085 [Mycobacterium gastri]